ncbi:hypothetical protein D3C76_1215280 [compost metagenome]
MLADQLLADQVLGLGFLVDAGEVEKGHAKLLRRHLRQVPALQQLVLHQIGNQRDLVALRLGMGLQGATLIEEVGQHQLFGQAR